MADNILAGVKCRHCGQSAARLAIIAMMQDLGVQTNNPADQCWAREDEGEHDFTAPAKQEA